MKKSDPFYALLALVSLSAGLLSSCCKMVDCTAGNAEIATVNLSTADIDTFYLRRYKLNTNFAQKIDTVTFRLNENFWVVGNDMDTLRIQSFYNPSIPKQFWVDAGFDYELVLPAIGKISRITNVTMSNTEEKICGMARRLCYAQIQSSTVDGVAYNVGVVVKN